MLGLRCNIAKSSAWGQSLADDGGTPPPIGLQQIIDGIRVLGSPVGLPAFCTTQAQTRLDEASAPLPLVVQLHPQSAMLILTRSISRRISYFLRTTPAEVMGREEWRGWIRTTATSNTSPRAQRAARREEAARLQERQQEEQARQEGLAAQEEPAADAVEAGAEETDLRGDVAAAGSRLTRRRGQGAAAEADPTGTGREAHSPAAVPAAASDDDSTAPAAGPTAPPADEVVAAEEAHVEHGSTDSPVPLVAVSSSPLGEVEIAAVVAEAARQPEQPPNEPFAPTAAESAGMSAAATAVNMRERGQAADGIEGPVIGAALAPHRQGRRPAQESARGGSAGVLPAIPRGGRGGRGGTRGRGVPLLGGEAAIVRSGTWRDRHNRPERVPTPVCVNGGEEGSENSQNGSEFIPSQSEASEDLVSLGDDENQHVSAQGRVRRTEQGGMPQPPNMPAGQAPAVPPQPSEKSLADLAKDESFWHLASTWDIALLQRADQPFLVRRLPLKDSGELQPVPSGPAIAIGRETRLCGGVDGAAIFTSTLRPLPEPVDGNRWIKIETRLHHFRIGDLADLYSEACTIPATEDPSRHQPDEAGLCARAEGLIKKANISKAVSASPSPAAADELAGAGAVGTGRDAAAQRLGPPAPNVKLSGGTRGGAADRGKDSTTDLPGRPPGAG
ncbi:unnamed protein product [Closterium sp. NIES-65]|nr:unnamed protein product [Closterium sp. NIES-65]